MIDSIKSWAGVVALLAIAVLSIIGSHPIAPTAGGTTNYDAIQVDKLTVGSGATGIGKIYAGTCTASIASLPLAATSSAVATCAVTGVAAGDTVDINLSSNPTSWGAFLVGSAIATTNTITFTISNQTGAATSSFPLATTSVQYRVISPLATTPGL